jgi:hypothetical protein
MQGRGGEGGRETETDWDEEDGFNRRSRMM